MVLDGPWGLSLCHSAHVSSRAGLALGPQIPCGRSTDRLCNAEPLPRALAGTQSPEPRASLEFELRRAGNIRETQSCHEG